jgi:hypothetical protein
MSSKVIVLPLPDGTFEASQVIRRTRYKNTRIVEIGRTRDGAKRKVLNTIKESLPQKRKMRRSDHRESAYRLVSSKPKEFEGHLVE